ncbi:gas vesicle protein GvpG [Streptomyces zhihengii]|uniref:Gas vesicle protein GvpG n=1 Tax=Streptomyces zhihengii TaxID=1818004 RepID=A0ABS2UKW3_9ACTN|nr:gas vesicle protein GvpG [Streptomyces zhihengii]MBM9617703.1 gas vesicle protein GvpG [Streptomyces zhihengii]
MGLITSIVTFPLAPVRGTAWVVDQVLTAAEQEYYDPEPVMRELAALERELTSGRISEEEYDRREDELLDRLEEIENHRQGSGGTT